MGSVTDGPSTRPAHIGVLRFGLPEIPSHLARQWSTLSPWVCRLTLFRADDRHLIQTLLQTLEDAGLGFGGEYKATQGEGEGLGGHLLIRCWILPSDATGSTWKRTQAQSSHRATRLCRLFENMRKGWDDGDGEYLFALGPEDELRMADLYAQVPSPSTPSFTNTWSSTYKDFEMHKRLTEYDDLEGVQTRLYRYQFRSVAKMLQMETQPDRLVDPLWTPLRESGRDGEYYLNMTTWDVQRHPGWYDLPQGGILSEQMGVGKSLMMLTLILATLHQPCQPPLSVDLSPTTTNYREKHYACEADQHLRDLTGTPPRSDLQLRRPTLVSLCLDILAINEPDADKSPYFPSHREKAFQKRRPLYYEYPPDDSCMRQAKRKMLKRETKRFYLANTTLLVCPAILTNQWLQEIDKHLSEGALKVHKVDSEKMPPIEFLVRHDIVIISVERFAHEENVYSFGSDDNPSVLLQARWKRIILDEGHIAGTKTSNAMRLAQKLSIERRWAVSGTPTKYLKQGADLDISMPARMGSPQDQETGGDMLQMAGRQSRAWSTRDLDDAARLGVIIGGFLAAEPFKSDLAFQERVTAPLRLRAGPKFDAVRRIRYLMNSLMVKHAPKVIEIETPLPPSTRTTEILRFCPMQRLTYNVLAALVASNVYTSAFEDQDYFLHPRNVNAFNQVIKNLHLACFWYSALNMGAQDALRRTMKHLEENDDITPHGRERLKEAAVHLERAIESPGWDTWMKNSVSLPFDACQLPPAIRQAWSDNREEESSPVDTASLILLRDANLRGVTEQQLLEKGAGNKAAKIQALLSEEESASKRKGGEGQGTAGKKGKKGDKHSAVSIATHETISAAKQPPALPRSPRRNNKRARAARPVDEVEARLDEASRNALVAAVSHGDDDRPRPLPDRIQATSRSAKLNFVLQAVIDSAVADKFVIFGDTMELGHVTEALDLFEITSCFAGYGGSTADMRNQALQEFQKPHVKVCLLDLRLAARGLNLVVANRMIFLSPVWSPDVLAQAIKRVHRIGQTRPTRVQILAIEGTFEEDIVNRAAAQRTDSEEMLYSRAMIENPRFVYTEREPSLLHAINMTPLTERSPHPLDPPHQVATPPPAAAIEDEEGSPASTRITTPSNRRTGNLQDWVKEEIDNDHFSIAQRAEMGGAEETKDEAQPRKRARVAFA